MDRDYQEFLQGVKKAERIIDLLKQQECENKEYEEIVLIAG